MRARRARRRTERELEVVKLVAKGMSARRLLASIDRLEYGGGIERSS